MTEIMKTTARRNHKINRLNRYYLRPLIGAVLLSAWMVPALADGTPAGTTIDNTAYGSFENPSDPGTPINVNSNTVTLTIAEVAGIDVAARGAEEAPTGVPGFGPGQGDSVIGSEDVVYFTFRITNIGNDQTQFFIPDAPANVDNGTFDAAAFGPIQIVEYSDGTTVDDTLSINIPSGGAATGSLAGLPNGGSIPVDGYIEIRVPIKADAGLVAGTDEISVVMGNTPDATSQNVPFVAGGEFGATNTDIYTQDNADGVNGDLVGSPSPEREASDVQSVGVGDANLDYGDAPDAAPGTATGDPVPDYETEPGRGPSHVTNSTTFLGTGVDAEPTAFNDGNPEDDGVVVDEGGTTSSLHNASFIAGQPYALDVTTAGTGVLNAWIDFNRDGDFDDAGEQIATNVAPTANLIELTGNISSTAVAGDTYARFRYSSVNDLGPNAPAPDGEVEDYRITLVAAEPALKLVKRITSIGGTAITGVNDDPTSTDDDATGWPAGYLAGDFTSTAEPGEDVDYTIYFLADGNTPISNVKLCDLIPDNTTYQLGSLLLSQGTGPALSLTDANDALDEGYSFDNTTALIDPCQGTNSDGGVYVEIPGPISNSTGAGTPADSYGFIRFTVRVD